ncbi:single-stranded DNA-binding protein [Agaribacterium sp. ZY112]|uniref:single-stranded DNA-binding protein n=1 Tax=Agaribacterium sp. ZY112 TaxID=3233574 RepID=UPI003526826A
MVKISIIDGHHQAKSRNTKNGVRYFQDAYVHLGGAFPHQIEIPLKAPTDANPVGEYELSLNNFQVGRFKNLELNPFEVGLIPLSKTLSKAS